MAGEHSLWYDVPINYKKNKKTGLITMYASLIKFAVAVLAGALITGCSSGSSAKKTAEQSGDSLPVAVQSVDFTKITDARLANCVKENGIKDTGAQTLICADKDIEILDGIEQFANLRVANLSQNKIQNTQPLSKLSRLVALDVSENSLHRLNGIDQLSELYKLNVNNNQLADVDNLQQLKKLKRLYIRNNLLQSLSFVSNLESLENLDAENNQRSSLPRMPVGIKTFSI